MKSSARMLILMALVGPGTAGCSTVRPMLKGEGESRESQAAIVEPASGRGVIELETTPDVLGRAVPEAMADLQMTYVRTRKDGSVIQVDGKTADRRTVGVTIRPLVGKSRLSSRIGWFGDTSLSQALAERVGIRAGLLAPKPIPELPPSSPDPNPIFSRSAVSDDEMFRDLADAPYRDRVVP